MALLNCMYIKRAIEEEELVGNLLLLGNKKNSNYEDQRIEALKNFIMENTDFLKSTLNSSQILKLLDGIDKSCAKV